ncbi:MAG: riboflavin biosynthesis protein RibF [Steroidobacterales bacterium]
MELIRRFNNRDTRDCVAAIGGFDGLHLGHQALLERARSHAQRRGLAAMMLSFEPLPREFLQPQDPPARLTNLRERWRLLSGSGLDRVWLLPFDARARSLSGAQFLALLQAAAVRTVVIGHDFRFGRGGEANAQWCTERAAQFGLEVDVVAPVLVAGERVSSGLVRAALAAGDLARAQRLLGRQLGFPTANIAVRRRRVPLTGIFAVRVSRNAVAASDAAGATLIPGVASLGLRPMVGGTEPLLEAHLFDFDADLYGSELEVQFIAKLRDERSFESMDAMVAQMHRDAGEARRILGVAEV